MKQPLAFTIGLNATKALRKTLDVITAVEQAVEAPLGRAADAALRERVAGETGVRLTTDSMSQRGQPDLPPARRPQMAIDLFLTAFAGRVELMHQDEQVFLRKTQEVER